MYLRPCTHRHTAYDPCSVSSNYNSCYIAVRVFMAYVHVQHHVLCIALYEEFFKMQSFVIQVD